MLPSQTQLASVGIKFNLPAGQTLDPIAAPEDLFVQITADAVINGPGREFACMLSWIQEYGNLLHVAVLEKLLLKHPMPEVRAVWAAIGLWQSKDSRFRRLTGLYNGKRITLRPPWAAELTRLQLADPKQGEDPRFQGTPVRIPAQVAAHRPDKNVKTLSHILATNHLLANRVRFGPNYRADLWTWLEHDPTLSISQLRKHTGVSQGQCSRVKSDYMVLAQAAA